MEYSIYLSSLDQKLPKYSKTKRCVMCGSKRHVVNYSSQAWVKDPGGWSNGATYPHLHVRCGCGFSWVTAPIGEKK